MSANPLRPERLLMSGAVEAPHTRRDEVALKIISFIAGALMGMLGALVLIMEFNL